MRKSTYQLLVLSKSNTTQHMRDGTDTQNIQGDRYMDQSFAAAGKTKMDPLQSPNLVSTLKIYIHT